MPSSTSIGLPSMISCLGIAAVGSFVNASFSGRAGWLGRKAEEEAEQQAGQAEPEQDGLVRGLAGEARRAGNHRADAAGAVKTGQSVGEAGVGPAPGKPADVAHHRGVEGKPPEAGTDQ